MPLHPGARGLADDCAVLEIGNETLVITTDSMAAGTHWLSGTDPYYVAWKLVASNLSDLAAKGAEPIGVLLNYSLDEGSERFLEGLSASLKQYNVPLLGGDTIAAKVGQTHSLTAIGRATHRPVSSRAGAQIGDGVFVCGNIGDAMLGYNLLTESAHGASLDKATEQYFVDAFIKPKPMLEEGRCLAPIATAMMDVSDGLLLDAKSMADASEKSFRIELAAIPHSQRFRDYAPQDQSARLAACTWGDDYALLFTAPMETKLPVHAHRIGVVTNKQRHSLLVDGKPPEVDNLGYQHR